MPFKTSAGIQFMGIIQSVSANGRLLILRDDGSTADFDVKEIQLLY
jgi:BirA family biotin operon repressor/biotin-[acetyl-CoA-carboxylase] ligase